MFVRPFVSLSSIGPVYMEQDVDIAHSQPTAPPRRRAAPSVSEGAQLHRLVMRKNMRFRGLCGHLCVRCACGVQLRRTCNVSRAHMPTRCCVHAHAHAHDMHNTCTCSMCMCMTYACSMCMQPCRCQYSESSQLFPPGLRAPYAGRLHAGDPQAGAATAVLLPRAKTGARSFSQWYSMMKSPR